MTNHEKKKRNRKTTRRYYYRFYTRSERGLCNIVRNTCSMLKYLIDAVNENERYDIWLDFYYKLFDDRFSDLEKNVATLESWIEWIENENRIEPVLVKVKDMYHEAIKLLIYALKKAFEAGGIKLYERVNPAHVAWYLDRSNKYAIETSESMEL